MARALQSGDYVSINDDSNNDSGNECGSDTEYDDRIIDNQADNETALGSQNHGILRPLRDISSDQRQRQRSLMEEDRDTLTLDVPPIEDQGEKEQPITWRSLVRLFLC